MDISIVWWWYGKEKEKGEKRREKGEGGEERQWRKLTCIVSWMGKHALWVLCTELHYSMPGVLLPHFLRERSQFYVSFAILYIAYFLLKQMLMDRPDASPVASETSYSNNKPLRCLLSLQPLSVYLFTNCSFQTNDMVTYSGVLFNRFLPTNFERFALRHCVLYAGARAKSPLTGKGREKTAQSLAWYSPMSPLNISDSRS